MHSFRNVRLSQPRLLILCSLSLLVVFGITRARAQMDVHRWVPIDDPAIKYGDLPVDDPISRLVSRIESGKATLTFDPRLGYLPSLLRNLNLNVDSQLLVFSKTSFQAPKIAPWSPRALFFNDTVAVGSVQGGDVLELAALDVRQGVNFYTLDVKKTAKPTFDRRGECLQCHQGTTTLGIPGIMVTSVYPSGDGTPAFPGGALATDHRTPFSDRWGGWYVTGLMGSENHMGNAVGHDSVHPRILDTAGTQNLTTLGRRFDSSNYMAGTSDVVALMTLEHQTRMTDLMIRTAWDARVALHNAALHNSDKLDSESSARIDADVESMVRYMLFVDEAHIYEPIRGVSTFTKTFPQRGPRDRQGRSLRDFDLQTRLFKHPLSYMIYSETFDAMPDVVRERVYRRLHDVLTKDDALSDADRKTFARLSAADRQAILEILLDTKPGLPPSWKPSAATAAESR